MRYLTLGLLLVLVSSLAFAQAEEKGAKTSSGGTEQQISAFLDSGRDAALKGDTSWQEKNLSDDYSFITGRGERLSKAEAIAARKSGDLKYESIEVEDRDIRVHGDAAVAQAKVKVKSTYKGQDISGEYWNMWVLAKQGGTWKLLSMSSTPIRGQQ